MARKRHPGGCHCRNVQYEMDVELEEVVECNCSICSKTGSLLTFVPPDRFHLLGLPG